MPRRIAFTFAFVLVAAACAPSPEGGDAATTSSLGPAPSATTRTDTAVETSSPIEPVLPDVAPGLELIGMSAGGRPLAAVTIGDGATRLYVVGGIHGDERAAVENSRALLDHLGANLPAALTVRWLLDANPDGSAARDRDNGNDVDLNRNWPTGHIPSEAHGPEALSEPETRAIAADMATFRPDLVVALHSAREGPFVNFDGPAGDLAAAFAAGASGHRTWEVVPEVAWPTPGSLGSHFGALGLPVVTVEPSRWDTPAAVFPELADGFDVMLAVAAGMPAPAEPKTCSDHLLGNACTDLSRRVNQAVRSAVSGGTSGYLLKEAGGLVLAARWADFPTYPASSIKVVHHLHLLRVAADDIATMLATPIAMPENSCSGTGSMGTDQLGSLDSRMMLDSDNEAANAIQAHFGLEALRQTSTDAGMTHTVLAHGFGCGGPSNRPANESTAADLVALYDGVVTGHLLDSEARDAFFDGMLDVTDAVAQELGLDTVPAGTRIVAKEGWYERNRSIGGVAFLASGTYVFSAYADRPHSMRPGFSMVRLVSLLLEDLVTADS